MKFPSVLQNEMLSYGTELWSPVNKIQVEHGVLVQNFFARQKFKSSPFMKF